MHRPPSCSSISPGGGLSRYRSAPAGPWLESLLEGDESDPLKSNQNFTQLLAGPPLATAASTSSSTGGIHLQNSSPVDFLGSAADGCFSRGFGVSSSSSGFDSAPPSTSVSFSLNGERSRQVHGAESSTFDMDMEKLLEDAVPCRVRAKRGFATHPRSIAERVRRTRISDRIRKLQELVPNMDKQTNTADMLDEAVEYVKSLQKQIQEFKFVDGVLSN